MLTGPLAGLFGRQFPVVHHTLCALKNIYDEVRLTVDDTGRRGKDWFLEHNALRGKLSKRRTQEFGVAYLTRWRFALGHRLFAVITAFGGCVVAEISPLRDAAEIESRHRILTAICNCASPARDR
jgi:hypothetical protein